MEKKKLINTVNSLISKGYINDSLDLVTKTLKQFPNDLDLLMMQGTCLFNLKKYEDSIKTFTKVNSINPNISHSYFCLAKNYSTIKKNNLANHNFKIANQLQPNNEQYLLDYSIFLYDVGQYSLSAEYLNKIINQNSSNYKVYFYLGLNYLSKFLNQEALKNFQKANDLLPNNSEIYNALGTVYERLGNPEIARDYFLNSFQFNKQNLLSLLNLATMEQSYGNFDESKKYLYQIIEINSFYGEAYRVLSVSHKFKKNDELLKKMEKTYEELSESVDKMHVGFALSKAFEDIKDYERSSRYLVKSNEYKRSLFESYNINTEIKIFNFLKKSFGHNFYKKFEKKGFDSNVPIFIVGMPRSGTTLAEQVLSSHEAVKAGGELNEFHLSMETSFKSIKKNNLDFSDHIRNISDKNIYQIGKDYCNSIQSIISKNHRITDKQPLNFQYIGLILTCLPKSKIIHCYRNSKDNCLSLYKNYFINNVMPWCYNQYELNCYYFLYKDLINFYISEFGNRIFNLNYETLISSPDETIRKILDYCDLDWDENCLKFYENKNQIKTASVAQARSKLYSTSIKNYQNYDKYLPELFSKLD